MQKKKAFPPKVRHFSADKHCERIYTTHIFLTYGSKGDNMGVSSLNSSMDTQADLVNTLMGGQMKQVDQAMKMVKVGMQMQLETNKMAQAQEVVAQMTGVGQNLNITT